MATKLTYIHGPKDEVKDRVKNVRAKGFIDSPSYTDGELYIRLLLDRANMLKDYYPEQIIYQQQAALLENALTNGLHNTTPYFGQLDNRLQPTAAAITAAKARINPSMSVLHLSQRDSVLKGIGDPYISQVDCNEKYPFPGFGSDNSTIDNWENNIAKCEEQNQYRDILNDNWEETSYHPVYEFVTNPNSQPATVTTKTILHKLAISNVNAVTTISRANIREWTRNGVMRNNIQVAQVGPLSPEETILAIKQKGQEGIGIELGTIIAIVTAVATLLSSASAFVNALEGKSISDAQKFTNQLQGWGTSQWGPLGEDWIIDQDGNVIPNPDSPNNNTQTDYLPLLLLGAGALILTQ